MDMFLGPPKNGIICLIFQFLKKKKKIFTVIVVLCHEGYVVSAEEKADAIEINIFCHFTSFCIQNVNKGGK